MSYNQQLYRSKENRMIGGVAGGLAEYFHMDVSLVRLIWIIAIFFGGGGVLAYFIAWLVIPETKEVRFHPNDTPEGAAQPGGEAVVEAADPEHRPSVSTADLTVVGCLLIGLGVFFLFKDHLPWHLAKYAWPVFLIGFGIFLLVKRPRRV